ncbi:MAG: D-glycero-beta-D-manno-heptose-7-phosphate kinase [Bacteroidetes bacterium]|jgi:D-glycero-beta-D-manno-heptose-7-phosphate kinase|nr:D-glycero-beta-D-manno-heptose-7-phosphate kinase [Bacteroidota bacterium]
MAQIQEIFEGFKHLNVLILGDVMVDEYYVGEVTRISPEAPVPVVSVKKRERRLGGAANVALNIKALGANPILCAVRGNDPEGEWLYNRLSEVALENEGIIVDRKRPTTIKTRVIGNNKQLLRVDQEDCTEVDSDIEKHALDFVKSILTGIDVVIFQDYNKGFLTKKLIGSVIKLCNKEDIPTLVDPKIEHFFDYKGVTLFKPNKKEIIDGLQLQSELSTKTEIESAIQLLAKKLDIKQVLLTLSEMGVAILENEQVVFIDAHKRKIADVSGAGDSVISVAALAVGSKMPWTSVAGLSNLAGGLVCEKIGVVAIDKTRLLDEALRIGL